MNKIAKTTLAALAFGFGGAITSLVATNSSAIANSTNAMTSSEAVTQMEVKAVIDALFVNVDQKDWKATRSLFTQNVAIDFTSLGGGKATIPSDDLVAAWTKNLYKDKLSLHMTSNHQIKITGDRAEAYLHGYAHNKLVSATGSDIWQTWGNYRINLERTGSGWKINTLGYFAQHNEGNERARDFAPSN